MRFIHNWVISQNKNPADGVLICAAGLFSELNLNEWQLLQTTRVYIMCRVKPKAMGFTGIGVHVRWSWMEAWFQESLWARALSSLHTCSSFFSFKISLFLAGTEWVSWEKAKKMRDVSRSQEWPKHPAAQHEGWTARAQETVFCWVPVPYLTMYLTMLVAYKRKTKSGERSTNTEEY
jgi:hypothetical protein